MAINNFNLRAEGFQDPVAWGPELINADSASVRGVIDNRENFTDTPQDSGQSYLRRLSL